jgi:hypothetical protein
MKTLYAACLARLGLSSAEAADLHKVRIDTVKSWSAGRNSVPAGAWDDLRGLESEIVATSEALREAWNRLQAPVEINVGEAGRRTFIAAADFVLGLPIGTPIHFGKTVATDIVRQARRPN